MSFALHGWLGGLALWANRTARLKSRWLNYAGFAYLLFAIAAILKPAAEDVVSGRDTLSRLATGAASSAAALGFFNLLLATDDLTAGWLFPISTRATGPLGETAPALSPRYGLPAAVLYALLAGALAVFVPWGGQIGSLLVAAGTAAFGLGLAWNIGFRRHPVVASVPLFFAVLGLAGRVADIAGPGLEAACAVEHASTQSAVTVLAIGSQAASRLGMLWPAAQLVFQLLIEIVPADAPEENRQRQGMDPLCRMLAAARRNLDAYSVEIVCPLSGQRAPRVRKVTVVAGNDEALDVLSPALAPRSAAALVLEGAPRHTARRQPRQAADSVSLEAICAAVTVPVLDDGSPIAALIVAWSHPSAFTNVTVGRIEQLAALLLPVVQSHREMDAVDQCGRQLDEMEVAPMTDPTPFATTQESLLAEIGGILRDVLQVAQVSLTVDLGFGARVDVTVPRPDATDPREVVVHFPEQWSASIETGAQHFGEIMLRCTRRRAAASLARSPGARRAIATRIAMSLLHHTRKQHSAILNALHADLLADTADRPWFEAISRAAASAGIAGVVVSPTAASCDWLGHPAHIAEVRPLLQDALGSPDEPVLHPAAGESALISARLHRSDAIIWFRVGKSLSAMFERSSPWYELLDRVRQQADIALERRSARERMEQIQIGIARTHALATIAAANHTLAHDLRNAASGIVLSSDQVREELECGRLVVRDERSREIVEDLIHNLHRSSLALQTAIRTFQVPLKDGDTRPANVLKAAYESRDLYAASMNARNVTLTIIEDEDAREAMADVPYRVAFLAIANLVGNARESIEGGGRIAVAIRKIHPHILVEVWDTGRGIVENLRAWVFDLGITTKESGSGWGLFLVKQSMKHHGGDVQLVHTGPEGTCFRLIFPSHVLRTRETEPYHDRIEV